MKTKKLQLTAFIVLMTLANFNLAIGQNMNRWIELSVTQGDSIRLGFAADAENTPVKIVSGTYSQTITVGTTRPSSFSEAKKYFAKATSMRIYGNLNYFDCGLNESKVRGLDVSHNTGLEHLFCSKNSLTSLDVSQNTALKFLSCFDNLLTSLDISQNTALNALYCYRNRFSRQALDDIYCALPQKVPANNASICVLYDYRDAGYDIVIATNKQNAIAKNWKVKSMISTDIPATTGTYTCPPVSYGIEIAGTELTSINAGAINSTNFPNLTLNKGTISYDHDSKTLKFSAAEGTSQGNMFVEITENATYNDYTIILEGFSKIKSVNGPCISTSKNLTIEGSGWMTAESADSHGMSILSNTLTIKKTYIGFSGLYCGITGNNLIIDNSVVVSLGKKLGSICYLNKITLINCRVTAPEGAAPAIDDAGRQSIMLNEQIVKEMVTISPTTGIFSPHAEPLTIYPNPAKDFVTVATDDVNGTDITITDLAGRTVMTATTTESKTTLDISQLSAGIYVVRAGNRTAKVVVK